MNLRHPEMGTKILVRCSQLNMTFNQGEWGSGDSNPDAFRHAVLSRARLPIPALPQRIQHVLNLVVFAPYLNNATPSCHLFAPA